MRLNKIFIVGLFIFFISCNKDNCIESKRAFIVETTTPKTGNVGENINIEIRFGVNNGCGQFGKFIETDNGNIKTIEVEALYEGCACTMDAPIRITNYIFHTSQSGTYYLKFKSSSSGFITDTLIIN